ncbi:DsbA family protein [Candidatus Uhrbacteria bacterium]|nr:DsbA family protein [Candidatus Uhrbacteria bacterium]
MQESSSNKPLIIGTIIVAALVFVGLVWAIMSTPSDTVTPGGNETVNFDDAGAKFQGNPEAKVVVRVYSDFQCPACRAAEPALNYAVAKYGDRVKFVWKDFPLMSIHANARNAANAAWCADEQGKYWQFHSLLFAEQASWGNLPNPTESFRSYANRLELEPNNFGTCYDSKRYDSKVMASVQEGNANRVNATPTVFVNNTRQMGLDQAGWDRVLTAALAQVETPVSASTTTP